MRGSRVRIALVGLGLHGKRLARAFSVSKRVSLEAVVSRSETHAREFAKEFGVARAESTTSFLKEGAVDAVCVAGITDKHAQDARAALAAKKHVLLEKPVATTLLDAQSIRQAAKKARRVCAVDFHLRMHPSVLRAKKKIASGALGDILHVEMQWSIGDLARGKSVPLPPHMRWREDPKRSGGGALSARGAHLFDLLRFLTGQELVSVHGMSDAKASSVDRTAIGLFTLTNGATAYVMTSKALPSADNRVVIHGTRGKIELRDVFADDTAPLYVKIADEFARAIGGEKTNLATIEDGIASLKATLALQESAKAGALVKIR